MSSSENDGGRRFKATLMDGVGIKGREQAAMQKGHEVVALPAEVSFEASLLGVRLSDLPPAPTVPPPPNGLDEVFTESRGPSTLPLVASAPPPVPPPGEGPAHLTVNAPTPPPPVGLRRQRFSFLRVSMLGAPTAIDAADEVEGDGLTADQVGNDSALRIRRAQRSMWERYRLRFFGDWKRRGFWWAIAPWHFFRTIHRR